MLHAIGRASEWIGTTGYSEIPFTRVTTALITERR